MTTVREFKQANGLNDSAFKRLVKKAKDENPGMQFSKRSGSTEWELLNEDTLVKYLPARAEEPPRTVTVTEIQPLNFGDLQFVKTPMYGNGEVIPESNVATLQGLNQFGVALTQGQSEIDMALQLVTQVNQLVNWTVQVQHDQAAVDESQVEKLEDVAFELTVHQRCLRRAGREFEIEQQYRDQRRSSAQSTVVDLQGFFDRRTASGAVSH